MALLCCGSAGCFNGDDMEEPQVRSIEINDAVYGPITLDYPLKLIVNTEEFQRLREIKQLGFSNFVYHSANHSRFEHSLGVFYLAKKLLKILKENGSKGLMSEKDILCVKIAALCHDLGHGPFSHTFERFTKRKFQNHPEAPPFSHERNSVKIFRLILENYPKIDEALRNEFQLNEKDFIFIEECIQGPTSEQSSSWPYKGRSEKQAFLYEIVANSENGFDVDKYDYLMRDSGRCGLDEVGFGKKALKRLLNNARVFEAGQGAERRTHICYPFKLAKTLRSVGMTRFLLHDRVYQHPVVKAVDQMGTDILLLADPHLNVFPGRKKSDGSQDLYRPSQYSEMPVETFCRMDDSILSMIGISASEELGPARQLRSRLLRRDLYVRVGFTCLEDSTQLQNKTEKLLEEEIARLGNMLSADDVVVCIAKMNRGLGSEHPVDHVWFYNLKDLREEPWKQAVSQLPDGPKAAEVSKIYVFVKEKGRQKDAFQGFHHWCHSLTPPLVVFNRAGKKV